MKKERITLTISPELYDKIDVVAKSMGISRSALCTFIVAQNLTYSSDLVDKVSEKLVDVSLKSIGSTDSD